VLVFVLGAMTALVGVLAVEIGTVLRGLDGLGAPRVKPIPIPSAACPYLRAVRDAATAARDALFAQHDSAATWELLSERLDRFDEALREAMPRVPPRVAASLRAVLRRVDIGRAELPYVRTDAEYHRQIGAAPAEGFAALVEASHLVGDACTFELAPDPFPATMPVPAAPLARP
jgi:hypothetical protein